MSRSVCEANNGRGNSTGGLRGEDVDFEGEGEVEAEGELEEAGRVGGV
jgi:hypothetical protein